MNGDHAHMHHALALAGRALGLTAPNPAVGCVLVKDGIVVGRGWTQRGGRPHAERVALDQAGTAARGATAYVTLEPCSHHGQTPPCAEGLIGAGVSRVVVAVGDPDPRVNGRGLAMLREAGITVEEGICQSEAAALNQGFFLKVRESRPLVTLKIAQSLDGRIATATGESQWITSEAARRFGHLLRATHDAILIGSGTAKADDPALTCRLPGLEDRSPIRVVLDSRIKLNEWSNLAQTATQTPTLLFTAAPVGTGNEAALAACGVEILRVGRDAIGRPRVDEVLTLLAGRGITRLLVEGGASVHASFLDHGLVDRLEIFTAPMVLGGSGRPSVETLATFALSEAPRFKMTGQRRFGADLLVSYAR
jgi:diaminohydroxyphosphoribosylaminopyrimidine deaminase/5-amino-6-(5-phosphoribosylamino)uracil reductase